MKILHTVESYFPLKNGMAEVVRQISENLVEFGHDVYVATSYCENRDFSEFNGVHIVHFKISGNSVNGIIGCQNEYINYINDNKFDIVTNFAAQQWATDICLLNLDIIKAKKFFVPTGFSSLYDPLYKNYYIDILNYVNKYDKVVFLSENYRDINFLKDKGFENYVVIPNGASKKEFEKNYNFNLRSYLGIENKLKVILHVGSYTEIKGHTEALEIFLKLNDKNNVLVFVGENFFHDLGIKFSSKFYWARYLSFKRALRPWYWKNLIYNLKIKISGLQGNLFLIKLSRNQLIQAYKQADIFLFPSNLECSPVVLFESMASNTPFLSSDVGNASEIAKLGESGIILPTKEINNGLTKVHVSKSVQILREVLNSNEKLLALSSNGYKFWSLNYTWENIAKKYEMLYSNSMKL